MIFTLQQLAELDELDVDELVSAYPPVCHRCRNRVFVSGRLCLDCALDDAVAEQPIRFFDK